MIRAILFDIYQTLLRAEAAPGPAEPAWQALYQHYFAALPPLTHSEFRRHCASCIARRHAADAERGIQNPEVCWPAVVEEVLPEAGRLLRRQRDRFIQREVQLLRRTDLNPGAAEVLREGIARRLHLGIVSNAQAYTLPELESALKPAGLGPDIFDPLLVFWSFQHGFSKPNPHAFRILQARLDELGIRPGEVLLVGDRFDNDIAPARAFGWRTWWLAPDCDPPAGGTWPALLEYLQTVPAPESPMPPGQDS